MVTPGKERQAAMAERRRAAGLVRVGGWVPAHRKAEALAYLASAAVCADTTPLRIEAKAAPSAQTVPTLPAAEPTSASAIQATEPDQQPEPTVGDRVRSGRTAKKFSRPQLAAQAGISAPLLGKIERGEVEPTPEVLQKLGELLEIEL